MRKYVAAGKPGWKTDRGKIYIILGKPVSMESYGAESWNLVPIEIWFYQGEYGYGLPNSFYVLFFKDWGMGDYILYSPVRHGPQRLLDSYDGDPSRAIDVLKRINMELANISLSFQERQRLQVHGPLSIPKCC